MSTGLLNNKEFNEFKDVVKYIGSISKSLEKTNQLATKENTIDRQHIDAINALTDAIKIASDKITNSIDALTEEIKCK